MRSAPARLLGSEILADAAPNADVATTGHAVLSTQLTAGHEIARCPSIELLRGSLLRRGVRVQDDSCVDLRDGELAVFGTPVPGCPDTAIFAAASSEVRDAVRQSVAEWSEVAQARTVLLASPRSFCAGVERAIEIVERALQHDGDVYVRKQIVHNTSVVDSLTKRGAIFVDELDEVPDGATIVFSAHGVSPAVRLEARRKGLNVIDGTCPLVTKVHSEARRFAARGDTIVLVGHEGHEEVEGTMGEAPEAIVLVESPDDVQALDLPAESPISYLTQTTLAVDETAEVIGALRAKFPQLIDPPTDDICYATTNRQNALLAVVHDSDLVLVVGSVNSSNSVRLVELSRREGTPAHLIETAAHIRPEWLAGVRTVGLTAGASAPPALVDDVITALTGLGPVTVEERSVTQETVRFGLPAASTRVRTD